MSRLSERFLRETLAQLGGWTGDTGEISRTLPLDESQHAALTERIKVYEDVLQMRPDVRRVEGWTCIRLRGSDPGGVTESDIAFAARIEDAYRAVTGM